MMYEIVKERMGPHVIASDLRPVTPDDLAEAERLHKLGQCPHTIVQDEKSWPYDFRSCVTCGAGLGAV